MRAVTIDSDLATLFTFTPRKPPITPIEGVDRRRRTVDRLGRLNMQPPVLHSGATLADERRQMPSRPAGDRPSGENAR